MTTLPSWKSVSWKVQTAAPTLVLPPTRQGTTSAAAIWQSKVSQIWSLPLENSLLSHFLILSLTDQFTNKPSFPLSLLLSPQNPLTSWKSHSLKMSIPIQGFRLKALVGGAPMAIKWFKDNKELHSDEARSVWKDDTSTILELFSAKAADSGTYICQLSNDVGTATTKASLFVKGLVSVSSHCLARFSSGDGLEKAVLLVALWYKNVHITCFFPIFRTSSIH